MAPAAPPGAAAAPPGLPAAAAGVLRGHEGPVLAVRYTASGAYCLTCGRDRTVRLWNPAKGREIRAYAGHGYEVRDAAAAADSAAFASCGGDRAVLLWDVSTGAVTRRLRGHDGPCNAVAYAPNQAVVVSGGYDRAVRVWDTRSRALEPVQEMAPFRDAVTSVAVTERAEILAASVDGSVRRFDARAGRVAVDELHAPVTSVCASRDGAAVLAACTDGAVRLVDAARGRLLGEFRGHAHAGASLDAALTPDEAHAVAGSEDGRVLFWDVVGGGVVAELAAHAGVVCSLALHPGGGAMLTASTDGTAKLWTVAGGEGDM
jgi:mitogen-activated protein kinase organizer 1